MPYDLLDVAAKVKERLEADLAGQIVPGSVTVRPAADDLPPLTDAEIMNLRKLDEAGSEPPWGWRFRNADGSHYLAARDFAADQIIAGPGAAAKPGDYVIIIDQTERVEDGNLVIAMRNALPRLLDFAERARKLLGEVEWSGQADGGDGAPVCPKCRAPVLGYRDGKPIGHHKPGCELAALLGEK